MCGGAWISFKTIQSNRSRAVVRSLSASVADRQGRLRAPLSGLPSRRQYLPDERDRG